MTASKWLAVAIAIGTLGGLQFDLDPAEAACSEKYLVEETQWQYAEETDPAYSCNDHTPCGYIVTYKRWSQCWGPGQESDDCKFWMIWNEAKFDFYLCDETGTCVNRGSGFATGDRMKNDGCSE